jgi:predicted lipid carrier protein YhbT
MEKTAYVILAVAALAWVIAMIVGMVAAFPVGLIGLVLLLAFGLLFAKALRDRIGKSRDDRYSRDVEK